MLLNFLRGSKHIVELMEGYACSGNYFYDCDYANNRVIDVINKFL